MGRVSGLWRFDGVDDLAMMKNESGPFASWSLGKEEWAGKSEGGPHGRHQDFLKRGDGWLSLPLPSDA